MASFSTMLVVFASTFSIQETPVVPFWLLIIQTAILIFYIICFLALFKWQRWGFYGVLICGLLVFTLNLYQGLPFEALLSLIPAVGLFFVLQIGGARKGWSQLE